MHINRSQWEQRKSVNYSGSCLMVTGFAEHGYLAVSHSELIRRHFHQINHLRILDSYCLNLCCLSALLFSQLPQPLLLTVLSLFYPFLGRSKLAQIINYCGPVKVQPSALSMAWWLWTLKYHRRPGLSCLHSSLWLQKYWCQFCFFKSYITWCFWVLTFCHLLCLLIFSLKIYCNF